MKETTFVPTRAVGPSIPRPVVGYIAREVSGSHRGRDEAAIHRTAARLGYEVAAIVYDFSRRTTPHMQLMSILWSEDAAAVITPSAQHLNSGEVDDIVAVAEVIYLDTAQRHRLDPTGIIVVDIYPLPSWDGMSDFCPSDR